MLHWHYVGHFDLRDPVDRTARPSKPKVQRPIVREAVERALAAFGEEIREYVVYAPEGYVLSNWSKAPFDLWDRLKRFANALAEAEAAVVMSEDYVIEYPQEPLEPESVTSRLALARLVHRLHADLVSNPEGWENPTLESFLGALVAYLEDVPDSLKRAGSGVDPEAPSWQLFALVLIGARRYE